MTWTSGSARGKLDRLLRHGLERVHGTGPVLVPEYPLDVGVRWGWDGLPVLAGVEELLSAASAKYEEVIEEVLELLDWARAIPRGASAAGQPCWENDWWGTVDALVQCAALRRRNPAVYLEIGSGFSTLFARRAISDFGLRTRIVSIDPEPRESVDVHCDEIIRRPLQEVSAVICERIGPGDMMLLDSSHLALMGSDAVVFFLELMPSLPSGVLVGIDDVFLPWDYPPAWSGRLYGEQYLLAAFLLGGAAGYEVRFPAWWVVECSSLADRLAPLWPIVENRFGRRAASFWLERAGR